MGSNMAECHPVGFQWVLEAKLRGATVVHVDPRYTRTSANGSLHVPIRAGTEIAFLGGIIRHVLEEERYFREYVVHYTNAATIQLLLGNVGRPGGGIMALRGHASIQGSTDIPILCNLLPGYLPMPHADQHPNFDALTGSASPQAGLWGHRKAFVVSLLNAWFGSTAAGR